MDNPTVTIGSDIFVPSPPNWVRTSFTRIQYSQLSTYVTDTSFSDLYLSGIGGTFYQDTLFFDTLDDHAEKVPAFVTSDWYWINGGAELSSGILTPQNSIMPRPIVPSQKVVDNGFMNAPSTDSGNFNWEHNSMLGIDDSCWTAGTKDTKSVVYRTTAGTLHPYGVNIPNIDEVDEKFCLGGGAFQVVINIKPENPSTDRVSDSKLGSISLTLGDLELKLDVNGNLVASIDSSSISLSLPDATGSQVLPQSQLKGYNFYVISVYPCWNGVCVQSGIQTSPNMITVGGYVPKKQGAGFFDYAPTYTVGKSKLTFDPRNPKEIKVKSPEEVTVTLGGKEGILEIERENCTVSLAFAPLFFLKSTKFCHAIRGSIGVDGYTYTYKGYPIWTDNGSSYTFDLNNTTFIDTNIEAGSTNSNIFKMVGEIKTAETNYQRKCAEVLGMIIEMKEEISQPHPNSKGEHPLGSHEDYIKSVSSSYSLDASSGSFVVDMYSFSGKTYTSFTQGVGAITASVVGWEGLVGGGGRILTGYSWTGNEIKSTSGYDVELVVRGVESRLDDVSLINPPIMDGYQFSECATYICQAAGVSFDLASSNDVQLAISTDINSVIYNWSTGITCKSALEQICKDTANRWFPYDGKIIFYALDEVGAPKNYTSNTFSLMGKGIQQYDARPDFDNIRNQCLLIAMEKPPTGKGKTFPEDWPVIPITSLKKQDTDPFIPWQRAICYTFPGFTVQEELDNMAENIMRSTIKYELFGSVTIPGKIVAPLDKVSLDDTGSSVLYTVVSVKHNVNLEAKAWTTSLELMR